MLNVNPQGVNGLTSLIDLTWVYLAPGWRLALTIVVHSSSLDDSVYIKASLLKSSSCNCNKGVITQFASDYWICLYSVCGNHGIDRIKLL